MTPMIERVLAELNLDYEILEADDGKTGYEMFIKQQDSIRMILSDINMPIMNGFEFCKNVRAFEEKMRDDRVVFMGLTGDDVEKTFK